MKTTKLFLIFFSLCVFASANIFGEQVFKMGMVLEPPNLDPTQGAAAAIDEVVYANLFEGLTRINERGEISPALAEKWSISKNADEFTFQLRKNVKFHDGSPFTAKDVKYSFEKAAADDSKNAQKKIFTNIASITVKGDSEVVVKLKEPRGNFLYLMGFGDAVIVSEKTAANNNATPVGTGPFRFESWKKGSKVRLIKNHNYWETKPKLDALEFVFISDPNAAQNALLAGDVDGFANFPAPELLSQFQSNNKFEVAIGNTEGETILAINNKKEPLNKLKVRQTIAHAIDKQAIIDGAMFGFGQPIGSHFSPSHPAYVDLTSKYSYDVEKAKKLLKEEKIQGLKLTLKRPPPSYARRGGEIVAAYLNEAGIQTEIIPVEWAQWLEQVFKNRDYDLTIVSHTEPMDIDIYARPDYYFNYENPKYNDVIAKLQSEADVKTQYSLMGQAQNILAQDSVNVFMFMLSKNGVWNKKAKGLWRNSPIQANDMTAVYWE